MALNFSSAREKRQGNGYKKKKVSACPRQWHFMIVTSRFSLSFSLLFSAVLMSFLEDVSLPDAGREISSASILLKFRFADLKILNQLGFGLRPLNGFLLNGATTSMVRSRI